MKKSISFLSLLLCLPLLICGLFFISPKFSYAENGSGNTLEIGSADELYAFIQTNFDIYKDYDIVLTSDIDMKDKVLTKTIGTSAMPFTGSFDGKGYSISNVTMELNTTGAVEKNGYAGLFGYTQNATIKNLQLSQSFNITMNANSNTYIGMLVGQAEGTTIDSCYITADFNLETVEGEDGALDASFKMINFGGLVGNARDTSIKNCILRNYTTESGSDVMPTITLDNIYDVSAKIGGLVGNLENSSLIFCTSQSYVNVDITSEYKGRAYIGGLVGYVSQANSKITNCVAESSLNVPSLRENCYTGLIGGYISKPAPTSYNISYVYYLHSGTDLATFGNSENYGLSDAEANLVASTVRIREYRNNLGQNDARGYFNNKTWNPSVGDHWDFVDTYIIVSRDISLQAFEDSFNVSVSADENIVISTPFADSYRYGDVASFTFRFNEQNSNSISNYYQLANITIGSTTVATFRKNTLEGGEYNYSLIPTDGYSRISLSQEDLQEGVDADAPTYTFYTITINGITDNYEGSYKINISPIEFQGSFNYRLYDGENEIVEDIKSECYVYYKNGQNQTSTSITIGDIIYDNQYTISTTAKNNSVYAFEGWYMVGAGESGEDVKISSNRDLNVTFGQGEFVGNFEVYAKYISDACTLIFKLDDGIEQIVLGSNQYVITDTDTQIPLLKQLTQLKMELYLKPNYNFDVDLFVQELNTYEVKNPEIAFCSLVGEPVTLEDGTVKYEFNLNLDNLNDDDYGDGFSITFNSEAVNTFDSTLIWIIVGSVGGALLLVGIIILIVVLVRRRGGGGHGGIKKSTFKNMYY